MKILHLFNDLMNLYGDGGNIDYLQWILKDRFGFQDISILRQSIGDELALEEADFIYCGAGSESNRLLALEYLRPYQQRLKKLILEDQKVVLFTGNSWTMLGQKIETDQGSFEGLHVFDFVTKENEQKRRVTDAVYTCLIDGNPVVGFINKVSVLVQVPFPLFRVDTGSANTLSGLTEGLAVKNCFGTFLIGPILVKNPPFLKMILKRLFPDLVFVLTDEFILDEEALAGYEITLSELKKKYQ